MHPAPWDELDRRLKRIEVALGLSSAAEPSPPPVATSAAAVPTTPPAVSARPDSRPEARSRVAPARSTGLFLAAIAGVCLLLAAVLMVKLAVDSGWLTPLRQVWMTALFGAACVALPLIVSFNDRRYASILPGIGIAVLNIAVYGAAFVHQLLEPGTAYVAVNAIAVLCLALYSRLKDDLYVIYAVVGTHLGFIFLGDAAPAAEMNSFFLLVWNVIFGLLSVQIASRRLLAVVAYFGFATVYFLSSQSGPAVAALTQALLFAIYLFSAIRYSTTTRLPMNESEVWTLLPPLLVFYMTEYTWLTALVGPVTPYLFLGFAAVLWIASLSALRVLRVPLASGKLVYLFVAATLLHSFFFQIVPDELKPIAGIAIAGALLAPGLRLDFKGEHFGLAILGVLAGMTGFLIALIGHAGSTDGFRILNGVVYGSGLLAYSALAPRKDESNPLRDLAAVMAHLQWMTALYRARTLVGIDSHSLAVSLLWIVYAFGVFALGYSKQLFWLCRSCLFIIAFCVGKLLVYDMWNQSAGVRIISLAGLGVSLYVFGLLLRKVSR